LVETKVDSFTFLLNKIQKELSELELLQDIGNDTNLVEKIKKIKEEIKNILLNKDIKKLEKIWTDYFVVTKPQQNTIEDDFM
jgi:hypothetical protein